MAKTKISEWSTTPSSNSDIDGINIAEGCAPSGINDAIRDMMAQIRSWQSGATGDPFAGPVTGAVNATVGATTPTTGAFTTLSASGAVTLSGGTANGVTYLNGSKVLTSGSALTFDGANLGISTTSPAVRVHAVSGVNYQYRAGYDASNYMDVGYFGTNTVAPSNPFNAYFLNGTEQMRLTSTGLGIGTSSPAYKLDVNIASGSVRVRSNTATANSAGYLLGNSYRAWSLLSESGAGNFIIADETTAGTPTRLTIDSSGNLGLGVTPSAWGSGIKALDVNTVGGFVASTGSTLSTLNCYYNSGWKYKATGQATYYDQTLGTHAWFTAASGTAGNAISFTQAMTLDASGNLLVGTTSSTYSAANRGVFELNGASTALSALKIGGSAAGYTYHDGTIMSFNNVLNGAMAFATNNTERARIASNGNFLINTTSDVANAWFHIEGQGRTYAIGLDADSSSGGLIGFYYGGTKVGDINTNGTTTSYVTSSDYRLKNTIAPMTGALAKVALLKPCTYKWNIDGSNSDGFIAHELAEVVPQCVTGEKDAVDEEGKPVYQGIDTSFLVATLTAAIQEQQAIIESLTARLDAANL